MIKKINKWKHQNKLQPNPAEKSQFQKFMEINKKAKYYVWEVISKLEKEQKNLKQEIENLNWKIKNIENHKKHEKTEIIGLENLKNYKSYNDDDDFG